MRAVRLFLSVILLCGLAACGSKFRTYNGPEVTLVVVEKAQRKMYLLHHDRVLKAYDIGLGFAPAGHKEVEGDGRTPEGWYTIDRRNPDSRFHLSIGISYPNPADREHAKTLDKPPGGDIFIHGQGPRHRKSRGDWTDGCIWITDRQMEDVYAMVRDGTPILIKP